MSQPFFEKHMLNRIISRWWRTLYTFECSAVERGENDFSRFVGQANTYSNAMNTYKVRYIFSRSKMSHHSLIYEYRNYSSKITEGRSISNSVSHSELACHHRRNHVIFPHHNNKNRAEIFASYG